MTTTSPISPRSPTTRKLAKAEVTLPSDREVLVQRSFAAPRTLVWEAYTKPALVLRWMLGPPGWSMPVCEMDLRPGGRYTWRWRSEDGAQEFGFTGTFREVDARRRIVHTQAFDPGTAGGTMGDEGIVTLELHEEGGITLVTTRMDFGTQASRDAALATGMTDGMEMSYQLMDDVLESAA